MSDGKFYENCKKFYSVGPVGLAVVVDAAAASVVDAAAAVVAVAADAEFACEFAAVSK